MKNIFDKKIEWLREWTSIHSSVHSPYMNVLDSNLVDAYVEHFQVPAQIQPFGANRCPDLGRILSKAYKLGIMERYINGVREGRGFPKHVYVYNFK